MVKHAGQLVLTAFLVLIGALVSENDAVAQGGVSVKMLLSDASTGEPVGFATVSLTDTTTSKTYKFEMSTEDGKVQMNGIRNGVFRLKAEMMGYKPYEKILDINGRPVDLGTVRMSQDVEVLDLSVRAMNCLNNANIKLIGELVTKTESRMLKYRNFGKKSLDEIKEKIEKLNLGLGMQLSETLESALEEESAKVRADEQEEK